MDRVRKLCVSLSNRGGRQHQTEYSILNNYIDCLFYLLVFQHDPNLDELEVNTLFEAKMIHCLTIFCF